MLQQRKIYLCIVPPLGSSPEIITIDDNTLWGNFPPKIYESEIKDLPPSEGFVVLPEVVVPEFIIVHDGHPSNASAPNYWVPFKDYIKNMMCIKNQTV